ncbi:MAG TPA: PEP-CTERM sorting domain-containing protein [Methylibium sp.]|nr:PEP-CTERM sorting domain-containing protein [Methylibium sp.]
MIRQLASALAVSLACLATNTLAAPVNGGFESGLSGWATIGDASATATNVNAGTGAALITSGTNADVSTFSGTAIAGTGGGGISQSFSLGSSATLSFAWDFQTSESTPSSFNDAAYVVIDGTAFLLADTGSALLVGTAGDGFSEKTGYQTFSINLGAGNHTLAFVVTDFLDTVLDSGLFVDSISTNSTEVPEPGSLALLGLGLVGLAGMRKRAQR